MELIWNVYREDFNGRKIKPYNIFDHVRFNEDVIDAYRTYSDDFETFSKEVRHSLMYYFWSKCEWEVVLTPWVGKAEDIKIDAFDQVTMNWDAFITYTFNTLKSDDILTPKTNLEIAKDIIRSFFGEARYGIFNTPNWVGDKMDTIYDKKTLLIQICWEYGYFEVFGLTEEEFTKLEQFYENLKEISEE